MQTDFMGLLRGLVKTLAPSDLSIFSASDGSPPKGGSFSGYARPNGPR